MNTPTVQSTATLAELKTDIVQTGMDLGFQRIGISDIDLAVAEERLWLWIAARYHGTMDYMHKHGRRRAHPDELIPGTLRVIAARMDYLPQPQSQAESLLDHPSKAYISRYALGRDYHKVLRHRLQQLATHIESRVGPFGYRVFVDSGPVLEKPLAQKAGLGWIGKHTNLIDSKTGSWFFLGELYTDLPLPIDKSATDHCGTCKACMDVCPTKAIVAPYQLDARRCISYLTIESRDSIPLEFRKAIGNRIYGCDDCQLVCPWNKFAKPTAEKDFAPRHGLESAELCELFAWSESEWLAKTEGSAIRRIGYTSWLRNIAIALGNATASHAVVAALQARRNSEHGMLAEHIEWALAQHSQAPEYEKGE